MTAAKHTPTLDQSTAAVLRRRYKDLRQGEGYNEEYCRVFTRAADQLDALVAALAYLCAECERCHGTGSIRIMLIPRWWDGYDPAKAPTSTPCGRCSGARAILKAAQVKP